jgi:hypothetical protein
MKRSSLQRRESNFMPNKFDEIDPNWIKKSLKVS